MDLRGPRPGCRPKNGAEAPVPGARAQKTPERAHPVTLRDVAEAAGVSTATVSLVVNKKKAARIAEETRRRVQDAIRTGRWESYQDFLDACPPMPPHDVLYGD